LKVISESVPFTPSLVSIKELLNIGDIRTLKNYFNLLEELGLINIISRKGRGLNKISKPEKIYLSNTNYLYALCDKVKTGTIRETFFVSSVKSQADLKFSKNGDFSVNDRYTVEVGGKNKGRKQIKEIDNSFLVLDNIEYGTKGRIPLWLFGFLY